MALRQEALAQVKVARAKDLRVVWRVGEQQLKAFQETVGNIPGLTVLP